jgi:AcrR family transcriptional regulator
VWRIVARDGVSGASVRAVAREAGLSMGSVRHFFANQDQLLRFSVEQIVEQASRRIEQHTPARMAALDEGRPLDAVAGLLEEVLPLDTERMTEAMVWAAFTAPPAAGPGMSEIRASADSGVRELCANAIDALRELGLLHADRRFPIEIERLHALLDGLTIHLMLEPARVSTDRVRAILLTHLAELSSAPPFAHASDGRGSGRTVS